MTGQGSVSGIEVYDHVAVIFVFMRLDRELPAVGHEFFHGIEYRANGPTGTESGAGKSPASWRIGHLLADAGLRVALVRHSMPCGDLSRMRVQRFGSLADIDAASPSIEEREEADVIVWDGGNNDTPFFRPTVTVCVLDPLRPGDGMRYHPGETNLVMADVVLVNKVDAATPSAVEAVISEVLLVNPNATVVQARSPVTLDPGPDLVGARVVVIEDGPTVTHGGMGHGAGLVASRAAGATVVDPRPWAVGSIAETFARHPHLGPVLPAMGYGDAQLAELGETIRAVDCDVVVTGTPMDLARVLAVRHPARRARYRVEEVGHPSLDEILTPWIKQWNPSNPG
ncbi:MAG: hypothetical protein P8N02_14665 [Actinomycetota bacterium]|nr:hypothetical protein [Actinomycetota bacterium]